MDNLIRAVIFDLDGTLVSSSLDFAAIREELACPKNEDILAFISGLQGEARERAELIVHKHEMIDAQTASLLPGVRDLLANLSRKNVHTAIVTRNSQEATYKKLNQVNIQVEQVLTRECAPPKPDPSALLRLCCEWNIKPDQAIYVGDFLYDLIAAKNAEMHSCLYIQNDEPAYSTQAGFVCRDYRHFIDELLRYMSASSAAS